MSGRLVLALAVLLGATAFSSVHFSSATWTAQSSTGVSVGSARDWTPPTVTVDDPGSGVSGTVTVTATATDDTTGVASVVLAVASAGSGSWSTLCTDTTAPWACVWDTATVPDGPYDLRAVATDGEGNTATSPVVTTTVANGATVVLAPVASPTGTVPTLSATLTATGGQTGTLTFQQRPTGGSGWTTACAAQPGPTATCTPAALTSGTWDLRVVADLATGTLVDTQDAVVVDLTDPTVSLSVPAGLLSGTVTLGASAADAHTGVAGVAFEYRATGTTSWSSCGSDTTAPYTCALATTALADGSWELRAVATDLVGHTAATAPVTRTVDNGGPTLTLTVPPGPLSGTVSLTSTATDPAGVASVTFEYRAVGATTWTACGTDATAPYACSLATGGLADGSWELRATAVDGLGNTGVSAVVTRTVANSSTVAITSPAAGAVVRGNVTVTSSASSTLGVTSVAVEYRAAGATAWTSCGPADSTSPYTCQWSTGPLADGSYELRSVLTDGAGRTTASATVAVVVKRLRGADVQGATVTDGTPSATDTVTLTFSGVVDLATVKPGWTSGTTGVPVVLHHSGDGTPLITGRDYLTFTGVNLGQVAFAQNYINSQSASFGNATMVATTPTVDGVPVTRITITLGAPTSGGQRLRTTSNTGAIQWSPSAAVTDADGTACDTATVTETGGNDADL
ncbi:Ig-like domain-containing protein [Nocardioides taihuensis]|uniref:Ig-like domain-containing protein n=1 Tax=Nocardioides taihuensis TaxID=1835606 RepID=A0ABW0BJV3_9ACTN